MNIPTFSYNLVKKIAAYAVCMASLASCGTIYDGEGDCPTSSWHIKFRYDWNIKFADAFANEVKSVNVYFFDEDGLFIKQYAESGDALKTGNYTLPVEATPGTYQIVTWGGLKGHEQFAVQDMIPGVSTIDQLTCKMARQQQTGRATEGEYIVNKDLNSPNALFHAYQTVTITDERGKYEIPVSLKKNTNTIRVILQHMSGEDIKSEDFDFRITDENGLMNFDNTLLPDAPLTYLPWYTGNGKSDITTSEGEQTLNVAVADFTVGRLMTNHSPRLTVTSKLSGETVLSIPLVDYFLMVKGNYRKDMSDQDYLDRQDEYSLTFFLDNAHRWDKVNIIINSWKLVINQETIG